MPTYTYRCTDCGHDLEAVQAFSDASLTECPACGGRLRKTYGSVGIVFKGSGFYRNDSRKGSGESSESGESGAAAGKADKADKAEKGDGAPTKKPAETTAGDRTPGAGKSGDNGSSGGAKGSPGGATTSPAGGTTSAKAGSSTSSGSSAA